MKRTVCTHCLKVDNGHREECPECGADADHIHDFTNSDLFLTEEAPSIVDARRQSGLEGLIGDLAFIIINTEPERHNRAVEEMLTFTGLQCTEAIETHLYKTTVLRTSGSADFLVRSRIGGTNPFKSFNRFPKASHLPDTRLETFVFTTSDLCEVHAIHRGRGVRFMTEAIEHHDHYDFIQTVPLETIGTSIGFIEWKDDSHLYASQGDRILPLIEKQTSPHLQNIHALDHTALRVRAKDRDQAIIDFMALTNYNFQFAIYVKQFNSITNVARCTDARFAMVFTSGIKSYIDEAQSGPTEKYIHNYGTRVHHLAFDTDEIEHTCRALQNDGMDFLLELVGSPGEGLKQTFSKHSENTLLINEYIHRYGDFDGFFTRSNVSLLTEATSTQ